MSKRNSSYWQKRFTLLEDAANRKGRAYYADLEKQYEKAQRTIDAKIQAWYGRLAINNNITMAEARKLLTSNELKEFKWDVKEYIKYGQTNALNEVWMKQLENASAKFHISRLEALKIQTQQTVEELYGNQVDGIDQLARSVYTNGYYHTAYEIQKGFNVGYDISGIDKNKLDKIISSPWAADGKNFSSRVWDRRSTMVSELHTQLTQTILTGKAPDEAIKNLSKFVDKKFKNAKVQAGKLVMTESAYFSSAAQKDAFNELDVEKFEIVATLDSHTSEICQGLDGQVFDMKDYEPGVTAPPFHVWCRSTTVPWFEDNYGGERAARGEDGKTYYVPDDMKYADWKQSFVDGGSKDGLDIVNPGDMMKVKEVFKFTPANSIDEVKQRITSALGTSDINFGRMDVTLANQYLEGVETFTHSYPHMNGYIQAINTKTSPRAFGQFEMMGNRINGNKNFKFSNSLALKSPKDYQTMISSYEYNISSNFLYEGASPKTTAIHELTHALASKVMSTSSGAFVDGAYVIKNIDRPLSDYIGCATNDIVRKVKMELYGEYYGKQVYDGMRHLGSYALSSDDEMIAQCVSYEFTHEGKPFSRRVKELFDEMVKGALK